jgi:hypothetical protein
MIIFRTIILTLSLLLFSCSRESGRIGEIPITPASLEQRSGIASIMYPQAGTQVVALAQLSKGYLAAELLRQDGRPVTQEQLEADAKRIDQNTKDAKRLTLIKNIFGSNRSAYLQVFILPDLAERTLYQEVYPADPAAKGKSYDDWFWAKAARIPVHVSDRKLKQEFVKQVSWAKNIRFN